MFVSCKKQICHFKDVILLFSKMKQKVLSDNKKKDLIHFVTFSLIVTFPGLEGNHFKNFAPLKMFHNSLLLFFLAVVIIADVDDVDDVDDVVDAVMAVVAVVVCSCCYCWGCSDMFASVF